MIAPLITLTYPLDKISDGKAQAFNMWIREYIFNALIQVVHIMLYIVLISSAESLVKHFPIFFKQYHAMTFLLQLAQLQANFQITSNPKVLIF